MMAGQSNFLEFCEGILVFFCIVVYVSVVTLAGITSSGILIGTEDFNIGHGCVLWGQN